jgi:peptidoglycan/LPS O-acetylase OafA/YrhL
MQQTVARNLADIGPDLRSGSLVSFLDMARWLAAAIVFVGHLRNPLFLGYGDVPVAHRTLAVKAWYFITGWHAEAVIVFFVLSGLLVGGAALGRLQAGKFEPSNYAIDRLTRLYLPFIPALILGYALDLVGSNALSGVGFWNQAQPMVAQKIQTAPFETMLSVDTFLGNLLMLQHYFVTPLGSNQPLWTISAEFWFYAVFLLAMLSVLAAGSRLGRTVALVSCALLVAVLGPKFLVLLGLWCIGVAVPLVPRPRWRTPLPALLLFAGVLVAVRAGQSVFDVHPVYREVKNYAVALSFAFVIVCLRGRQYGWLERMSRPNAFLAGFSYSLYLLHFPLMLFILALLHASGAFPEIARGFDPTSLRGLFAYGLTIGVVVTVSWLFAQATEKKTDVVRRFLKKRFLLVAPDPSPRH